MPKPPKSDRKGLVLPIIGILLTLSAILTPLIPTSFGDTVNIWAGIGQLILAVATFAIDVRRRSVAERAKLDPASQALARVVGDSCNDEARQRGLKFPLPLQLRWHGLSGSAVDGTLESADQRQPAAPLVRMFENLAARRLLILGEPGSGKSTLAMLFTLTALREVAARPAGFAPGAVPVLIPLDTWRPGDEPLRDYIVRRLPVRYPAVLGEPDLHGNALRELVTGGHVLPVLDGLDELSAAQRTKAIEKINDYGGPIVVTCQRQAYVDMTAGAEKLAVDQVIIIDAIKPADVEIYLDADDPAEQRRWEPVVAAMAADPDGPLAVAFSTPLIVSMARAVYADPATDPAELTRLETAQRIENHLFERLLTSTTSAEGRTGRERPLSILAYYLEPELAWWELAASVPPPAVAGLVTVAGAILGAAAGAVLSAFGADPGPAILYGLIAGVAVGAVTGAAAASSVRPRSSRFGKLRVVASALRDGLIAMVIAGAALLAIHGRSLSTSDLSGLFADLTFAGLGGLAIGLIARGLSAGRRLMPSRTTVNPADLVPWLVRGILVGGCVGLPFGVLVGIVAGVQYGGANAVSTAISAGVLVALGAGIPIGVGRWLGAAPSEADIPTPPTMLRADRQALVLAASVSATAVGIAGALLATVLNAQAIDAVSLGQPAGVGLGCGLIAFGVVVCGSGSPWFSYVVARLWFAAVRRQLPWNLVGFLEDAARADIMRSTGSVYQFRHVQLRRFLTSRFIERVRPSAWLVRRPEAVGPRHRKTGSVVRATMAVLTALVLVAGIGIATVPQLRSFVDRRDARVDDERARALTRAADAVQDDDWDQSIRLRLAAAAVDPDAGSLADLTAFLRVRHSPPLFWTRSNRVLTTGRWAVALDSRGVAQGWDLAAERPSTVVIAREVQDVEMAAPDRLAVVGLDGQVRVVDLAGPQPGTPAAIGADPDAVEPLGRTGWAVVSRGGEIQAWNLNAVSPSSVALAASASLHAVVASTGWVVVVEGGVAKAWHPGGVAQTLGRNVIGLRTPSNAIVGLEGEDGAVTSQWDLTADPPSAVDIRTVTSQTPRRLYSSPDGHWIVATDATGRTVGWNAVASAPQPVELAGDAGGAVAGAGPLDWFVTRSGDVTATAWNLATDPPSSVELPGAVQDVRSGPGSWAVLDGAGLVAVDMTGTPVRPLLLGPPGSTVDVQGTWLVGRTPGGTTRAWDTATDPPAMVSLDGAADVRFSVNGRWAVVTAGTETVENMTGVWDVAELSGPLPSDPVAYACQAVGRGLTEAEWLRYAPQTPYHKTC